MAAHRLKLTREGRERLERELEELRSKRRPELHARMRETRATGYGDTADLAEYTDAQWELARVEARIAELERLLARAEPVEAPPTRDQAGLGSTVLVQNEEGTERYTLVGPTEADPRFGRRSLESPVGRALLGRRSGEVVEVETPAGRRRLEILAVE